VVELPEADDRHVLAAAIKANGRVIVTENLKDFPQHTAVARRAAYRRTGSSGLRAGFPVVDERQQQASG
jgi:hypothetical protein